MMRSMITKRTLQRPLQQYSQQCHRSLSTINSKLLSGRPQSNTLPFSSSSPLPPAAAAAAAVHTKQYTQTFFALTKHFSTSEAQQQEEATTTTTTSTSPHQKQPRSRQQTTTRRPKLNPIILTPSAATRIKTLLTGPSAPSDAIGIRLGVRRRGCNGLSYTLNYASQAESELWKNDEEMESHGVKIFIEPMALMNVVGTTMDWEESELSSEFTFTNPNAKGECGCGESFNV